MCFINYYTVLRLGGGLSFHYRWKTENRAIAPRKTGFMINFFLFSRVLISGVPIIYGGYKNPFRGEECKKKKPGFFGPIREKRRGAGKELDFYSTLGSLSPYPVSRVTAFYVIFFICFFSFSNTKKIGRNV